MSRLRVDMPDPARVGIATAGPMIRRTRPSGVTRAPLVDVPERRIVLSESGGEDQIVRRTKIVSLLLAFAVVYALGAEVPEHARAATVRPAPEPTATPRERPAVTERVDRTVALTFDDGPSPWTPRILAVLRRHHVPATFCMLGDEAERYPAYARQVVTEGHQLCNHSSDHADMARLPVRRARREVVGAERQIRDAAGVAPVIFRYPYGSADRTARQVVRRYGMRELSWDVDPRDWTRPPARTITARIAGQVRPRSVVLLHDGGGERSHTVAALDATITQLQREGYRFVPA
jgi:peptidoglycan/xylan/chitin deacetylase (PgdA/CDA1 family)